jgi:hypothetical protein
MNFSDVLKSAFREKTPKIVPMVQPTKTEAVLYAPVGPWDKDIWEALRLDGPKEIAGAL